MDIARGRIRRSGDGGDFLDARIPGHVRLYIFHDYFHEPASSFAYGTPPYGVPHLHLKQVLCLQRRRFVFDTPFRISVPVFVVLSE